MLAPCASLSAQDNKGEPAAKNESSTQVVHYLLAGIATVIIMALICMPVRRE
jgi:hypothetical protein